ncbi:MAG: tetratricopeptide repeat protein [Chitinispirillaceae bacterium]|nr:tetratricopeptide repeat protein [Chitinispirillaceae bacterium]
MKKALILIVLSLILISLPGCSHLTVLRTKEMKAESDSLFMRIDSLNKEIVVRQNTNDELLRLIRADLQIRFTELEKRLSDLSSGLSESQYRLSRLDEKTADFQKQFKAKLEADSLAAQSKKEEIQKLFQIAESDFNAGRFDIAISGFKDLLSRFPDAPEGQEGQYWVAECHYAKKEYDEAVQGYLLYIKQNAQGPKMCAALYKLGLAYEKQNKSKSKDLVWKKLAEQCPESDEAKLIKSRKR